MSMRVNVTLKKKRKICSVLRKIKIINCVADLPKRFLPKLQFNFPISFNAALVKSKFLNFSGTIPTSFLLKKISEITFLKWQERIPFVYSIKGLKTQKFSRSLYYIGFKYSCMLSKLRESAFSSKFFTDFSIAAEIVLHAKLLDYDSFQLSDLDNSTLEKLDYITK